jgi:hypothetical protein
MAHFRLTGFSMRLLALALLATALPAADRWVGLRSGPFEVLTDAGDGAGRARLADLEQFRHGLEDVVGIPDIQPVWPIRVLVVRSAQQASPVMGLARDAYVGAIPSQGPLPPEFLRQCAGILIEAGAGKLSLAMRNALATLFSTLQVDGSRVTLGTPPPPAERSREWARVHMLTVLPGYFGKLRTLARNLEQGVEEEPAYRNAFARTPAQIEKEAEAYWSAGQFGDTPLRGRTIRPEKDFQSLPLAGGADRLALADLIFADPARPAEARAAYQAILKTTPDSPEALEGLGLVALRERQTGEARELLSQAVATPGAGARAQLEYARMETDRDKALVALERAAKLNPRWALPLFELAQREPAPGRRISLLAAAAKLDSRNVGYWRALAETQDADNQFSEAAKSWTAAELAATSPVEREQIRATRVAAEERRRQEQAATKRREADEKGRELQMLKQEAEARVQAFIDKANRENPPLPPSSGKVEEWWDGPRPDGKLQGLLRQVDCIGKQARLIVESREGKLVRLLVRDPGQIVILSGGEKAFGCGVQKPPRNIIVEYFTKPDAKLGTAGEAAVIEFP